MTTKLSTATVNYDLKNPKVIVRKSGTKIDKKPIKRVNRFNLFK